MISEGVGGGWWWNRWRERTFFGQPGNLTWLWHCKIFFLQLWGQRSFGSEFRKTADWDVILFWGKKAYERASQHLTLKRLIFNHCTHVQISLMGSILAINDAWIINVLLLQINSWVQIHMAASRPANWTVLLRNVEGEKAPHTTVQMLEVWSVG